MMIYTAFRDFADGLGRGLSLYFTHRHDHTATMLSPNLKKTR